MKRLILALFMYQFHSYYSIPKHSPLRCFPIPTNCLLCLSFPLLLYYNSVPPSYVRQIYINSHFQKEVIWALQRNHCDLGGCHRDLGECHRDLGGCRRDLGERHFVLEEFCCVLGGCFCAHPPLHYVLFAPEVLHVLQVSLCGLAG